VGPDDVDPTATITSPGEGDAFEEGASFDVVAEATDERGIAWVELYLNGEAAFKDFEAPYEWSLTNVDPGTYSFVVVASDGPNYFQSEAVEVTVGGGEETGDGEGDSGGDSSDASDETDDGDTDPQVDDDGNGGCGCRQGKPDGWMPTLMMLGLLPLLRRRGATAEA
jgi:MYXO-CTERM domain-containing protein